MRSYSALRPDSGGAAFTPTAGVANWVLEEVASKAARIYRSTWGGEVTVSTIIRSRLARDTAVGTGARTAIATSKKASNDGGPDAFISSAYATTPPTIETGSLFGTTWNGNGDVVQWIALDPDDEILLIGAQSVECRADVGAVASSYGLDWKEV